jgi:hypothetical protein
VEKTHFLHKIYNSIKTKNKKNQTMNIQINKKKVMDKWSPILDKMSINESARREWMAEYAEYHQINENVGYVNQGNLSGMGAVVSPQVGATPGVPGAPGSGDLGQQLLPVAMKVAAQTIGLDLVAVKPTPGPVIDLMYVDYKYDDQSETELNPILFKVKGKAGAEHTALVSELRAVMTANAVREMQGGLSKRLFFALPTNAGRAAGSVADALVEPASKTGVVEFLGFSRLDGLPMFAAARQNNAINIGNMSFKAAKNTFGETEKVFEAFQAAVPTKADGSANNADFIIGGLVSGAEISLVSALEDHISGFSTGGHASGMPRQEDEKFYPGVIAPNVTTKRIQVGTIEVSSALKRTEIEDIKAQTGIDIVQKLEGVLVNELSQVISKQIVAKLFEMGDLNRQSAPGFVANAETSTIFDFDVDAYAGSFSGGETSLSFQRKLITKIKNASGFIATEGRIGHASFIVTNHTMAAAMTEGATYAQSPVDSSVNGAGQLYPMGKIAGMTVYVDPNMRYDDKRILVGRKNNADQPGVIFVPYLMAQSISLISEATWAPRMLLRSRYAVAEVGFFPHKQFMTIYVKDNNNALN